jgi:hypothetical protein
MWKCPKCAEELEDQFESCWECSTPRPVTANADGSFKPPCTGGVAGDVIAAGVGPGEPPGGAGQSRDWLIGNPPTPVTEKELRAFIGPNADYYLNNSDAACLPARPRSGRLRAPPVSVLTFTFALALAGCGQQTPAWNTTSGVVLQPSGRASLRDQITTASSGASPRAMQGTGLAGAMGGIQVKVLRSGVHDLLLPLPQLADCQVPLGYTIACTPEQALGECRLQDQGDGNVFLNLKLKGDRDQEVKIDWAAVVLISNQPGTQNRAQPEEYLPATACAQADDPQLRVLADKLWPAGGKPEQYAREIQGFIRGLKQKEQPRSMDALGIVKSGANWICTGNANLATALMRARHLPCRSIAVIPPNSRRLEMHRVVEYFDDGKWVAFDPSSLQTDIPLRPWHSVIVAKTGIPAEQQSMKPRMCSALGCPFAQEIEISGPGLSLSGKDFYWSIATPLAEFGVSDEAVRLTVHGWNQFLQTGLLPDTHFKAASATNLDHYLAALKAK